MSLILRIEKPCSQTMDDMQDIPGGKFCNICKKNVLNLSNLNSTEIKAVLEQKKGETVCGILLKQQLNTPITTHQTNIVESSSRKYPIANIAAGIALTASVITTVPRQTATLEKQKTAIQKNHSKDKKQKQHFEKDGPTLFTGKVVSKKSGKPLTATVTFITITKVYSTQTDAGGNYTLEIPSEAIKEENLLEFKPDDIFHDSAMSTYTKNTLSKHQTIQLSENGYEKVMGEITIGPPYATAQSFISLNGKVLDYKIFNKSYFLYANRYEVYYIPKAFVKFFTSRENINDIYIAFVKKK
ncbi:hypothetical protein [Chryseobacterium sp. Mn2064]|uniref:hypothetical protein n=1 Tax=Chryseobacterium sp. Mn2064 TaxID=3395263 RepID=UPI003BC3628A